MNLPSEISFVSLLQYSPGGTDALARQSQGIRNSIKKDSFIKVRRPSGVIESVRTVQYCAATIRRLIESGQFPFLMQTFGEDVILVPMPRSAPLVKSSLWVPMSVCKAMKAEGLCREIMPILERVKAVQKSAYAKKGERPDPPTHYESVPAKGDR